MQADTADPRISNEELIEQGAEAKIYRCLFDGREAIKKQRCQKKYRHPELDRKLTNQRINSEIKIMTMALNVNIDVPKVLFSDTPNRYFLMEYIHGLKIKDWIRQNPQKDGIQALLRQMGQIIQKLHMCNIIHGDLTTSNMIYRSEKIVLIDFGLSYIKNSVEDKAVDLYVLERAFVSTHPQHQQLFESFYQTYTEKEILTRLEKVRQRGRKKVAFG